MNKVDVLEKIVKYLTRIYNNSDNNDYKQKFYQYSDLYVQMNSNNLVKEQYGGALDETLLNEIDTAYNNYVGNKNVQNKKVLEGFIEQISENNPNELLEALKIKFEDGLKNLNSMLAQFNQLRNLNSNTPDTDTLVDDFNIKSPNFKNRFSTYIIIYILFTKNLFLKSSIESFNKEKITIVKIITEINSFNDNKSKSVAFPNGTEEFSSQLTSVLKLKLNTNITNLREFKNVIQNLTTNNDNIKKLLNRVSNKMSSDLSNPQNVINLNTLFYYITNILNFLTTKESMLNLTLTKLEVEETKNTNCSSNLDNIFNLIEYFKKYIQQSKKFMTLNKGTSLDLSSLTQAAQELSNNISGTTHGSSSA